MTTTDDYQTRLDNIKTTFSLATDEYISSYPQARMNPTVKSYQTPLLNTQSTINSVNADLFLLESETSSSIESISKEIKEASDQISDLRISNEKLEEDATNIKGADLGSKKRYSDSQQRSFLELYSSIGLGIVALYTFSKMRNLLKTN